MKTIPHPALTAISILFAILLSSIAPGAASAQNDMVPFHDRAFTVRLLDPRLVESWIWEQCEELLKTMTTTCRVQEVSQGESNRIAVRAPDALHARIARWLAERDASVAQSRQFRLVVLGASTRGGGFDSELSSEAREALEELSQILPFDSYELHDTAFVNTTRRGTAKLSGPEGVSYGLQLSFREVAAVDGPVLEVGQLELSAEVIENGVSTGIHQLLSTSVSVRLGETVVVGTSKLNGGDQAVVVLLTALDPE